MSEHVLNDSCIFCAIAADKSPADIEYRDENVVAFRDINPQAPTHIVIIPAFHVEKLGDLDADDQVVLGQMMMVAANLAQKLNLTENGYRVVLNQGLHAGQLINHFHIHLLGGHELGKIA